MRAEDAKQRRMFRTRPLATTAVVAALVLAEAAAAGETWTIGKGIVTAAGALTAGSMMRTADRSGALLPSANATVVGQTGTAPSGRNDLKGRVAIVTGASVLGDIAPCAETIEGLKGVGARYLDVKTDVTREEDCNGLVRAAVDRFGRVDVLVSSAGVLDLTPIDKLSLEEWNRVVGVDLTGTFLTIRSVWDVMRRQKRGKIICLGSVAAKIGGALSGPHYVAAKAGVAGSSSGARSTARPTASWRTRSLPAWSGRP